LKEKNPDIKIIGVDPEGSILSFPADLNKEKKKDYKIEGIGYDFIPKNLDRIKTVDKFIKTNDKESFLMARRIIREEGLMVGGSCGSAMVGALKIAKDLPANKRVVVMLVDGIRNYMTKFLNDDWMLENGYIDIEEYEKLQKTSDNKKNFGENMLIKEIRLPKVTPIFGKDMKIREVLYEFIIQKTEFVN
jgi:cystathionine beta-synthase